MFYAHFVLSKKGPLARIWLAAHWDKKLTKAHVFETNIEGSVEAIIQPKVKLALRTSGHLLLGVVRIYSRKAKYLLADCNEAFVKIKMAFRPGVVDLPEENREATVAAITLPETFHDFDTTMADLTDIDVQAQFTVNQSRPEEITMREDLGNITLVGDDGFGDMGFGAGDNMLGDVHIDDTDALFGKNADTTLQKSGDKAMDIDLQPDAHAGFGDDLDDYEGPAGLDDDDDNDGDDHFGGGLDTGLFADNLDSGLFEEPPPPIVAQPDMSLMPPSDEHKQTDCLTGKSQESGSTEDTHVQEQTTIREQTTLIPNEAEAFALEPIDVTSLGTERRTKRKRKLIIDEQKGIPSESMKVQLSDTSDIVTTLDLAPPTKKLMHWKETGGVEKLFALPGKPLASKRLLELLNLNLITKSMAEVDIDQHDLDFDLEHAREPEDSIHPPDTSIQSLAANNTTLKNNPDFSVNATLMENARAVDESSLLNPFGPSEPPSLIAEDQVPRLSDPGAQIPLLLDNTLHNDSDDDHYISGPPSLASRRYSSDFEENEDNLFNEDLPTLTDETNQMEPGETVEDLEEKRWKGRTQQMMHIVQKKLRTHPQASFHDMIIGNNRKQVASKFYTLLVLKKLEAIDVEQTQPFGDIAITQGPKAALVF